MPIAPGVRKNHPTAGAVRWLKLLFRDYGTQKETRTPTGLPPLRPERSASTNSATWAPYSLNTAREK